MDFTTWTRALSARGLQVVPPSHPVPVELWALLPEGGLLHFRCQGTRVSLDRYAEADLVFVELPARCACDGGCEDGPRAGAGAVPPRVRVRPGARPTSSAGYDGTRTWGWSGHEAGLVRVAEAARFFDGLFAQLHPNQPDGSGSLPADLSTDPGTGPRLTPVGSGASPAVDHR